MKYAVIDCVDGLSRDLYASPDAVDAMRRDPSLKECPVGVLFAGCARSGSGLDGRRLRSVDR